MRTLSRSFRTVAALGLLAGLVSAAGCASDAMAATDNALAGHWVDAGDAYFTNLTLDLTTQTIGGPYGGTVTATIKDCGNGVPCGVTGFVIESTQHGTDVGIQLTFKEAPAGATIIGTVGADGSITGKFISNYNATGYGPFTIALHH